MAIGEGIEMTLNSQWDSVVVESDSLKEGIKITVNSRWDSIVVESDSFRACNDLNQY